MAVRLAAVVLAFVAKLANLMIDNMDCVYHDLVTLILVDVHNKA